MSETSNSNGRPLWNNVRTGPLMDLTSPFFCEPSFMMTVCCAKAEEKRKKEKRKNGSVRRDMSCVFSKVERIACHERNGVGEYYTGEF